MSNQTPLQSKGASERRDHLYTTLEQELQNGYMEVEITGMSMRRMLVAYSVLLHGAWAYAQESVRSLFRPTATL